MSKNIFEQSESRLEQERNVFLQKYGIAVRTDLQRADEIEYATDTQVLNKPKDNYFGMTDMEEPTENIAERALKEIPFKSLALSSPITAGAYLSYKLAKTPFFRGIFAAGINTARTASAKTVKDAATLGVAAGMDIDTRLKEHQKIDEEKAGLPASLRFQDKLMGDGGRVLDFLNPFEMVDAEKTNERFAAWKEEQKKVDDFNEKVKIHVDTFLENTGLARTEEDGFWYDLGSAGGSILTSIALLAATRNPLIGAMIFGQAEGQGTYEEAVASGVAPEKAYALGQANAAWIAMTEVIGDKFFGKLLYGKGIMGKFSKKVLDKVKKGKTPIVQGLTATAAGFVKGGSIEAIQEASQNVGSDVISLIGGVSEKTAGEIVKDALYAGMLAFILGSGPGGIATYGNFRKFTDNVSATLQDAGMDKDVADKIGREVALTATGKEMVDESLKAVSSEIDSPLTAEDRDPQKFAKVLTESQKREVEESSWKVGEKLEQDALKAGVAPEVAEASGRVAQALNNNVYTLAKITPTDQKNFNISVLKGNQDEIDRFVDSLPKEEQIASASALSGDLEFNAVSFEDEQQMQYSLEQAKEYADKTGFSLEQIQSIYDFARNLIQKSMKMGKMNKHDAFVAWNEFRPDVFIDDITQLALPLSSVFKKNGDYPINFDFGTICIKREALDLLIRHIVSNPDFVKNVQNMGVTQMDLMKYVLKENGYLTACDVCFVEGKRLRQLIYANSLSYEWESVRQAIGLKDNKMVGQEIKLTAKQVKILEEMADGKTFKQAFEKYMPEERRRLKRGSKVLDSGITADKMQSIAELFLLDQSLAGKFNPNWLLSSAGVDLLKKRFTVSTKGRISSFLSGMYGSATPKPVESQAPYVGTSFVEIDMNEEREKFKSRKQRGSLIEKLFNIGGARMQSFSDFNAMLTIDNLQLFMDCTLRGMPLQVYTKEPGFVKLFGETGANINMSFVPNVGENSDETNAGLKAATQEQIDAYNQAKAKGADYLKEQIVNRKIENVYTDEDGISWVYDWSEDSFPIEEAYKLRREFKGNVGIIGVGISDKHILMMLNDPSIDMVIPFHGSGMPTHTKVVTGLGQRTADYEKVQTTKGLKKGVKDFVFNEDLQKETKDAKKSAENYKKFCEKNGATPKYPQFKDHENYYKLLEDFRSYDNEGKPVIQKAVNILNINQDNFLKNLHEALGVREEQLNKMANLPQDTKTLDKLKEIFEPQRADGATREAIESRLQKVLGKDNVQILEQRKFFDALREEMSKDVGTKEAEKRVEVFRDSGKYVYGFAKDGKIFLNETTFNAETPAHEFTHIWVKVARAYNSDRWKEGVALLQKTEEWNKVKDDPLYANIRNDDDAVASEVLARIVGIENGKIINKVLDPKYKEPKEVSTAVEKVLEWFRKLWEDVRDFFDLKKGDAKLTYDEFVMMPLRDLWEDSRSSNFMEKLKNLREMNAMGGEGEMQTYYQGEEGSQRGEVTIDENANEAVIRIFQNSDPSTIIHELAHVYLTMIHNASQISVDPEFQQLVSDINAWLGEPAGENGAYSVEQQEMFARGFEGYMAEGKSPNKEMEGIFAKFAEWLAEVYKSVKDYLQITPEVRSIFDRLLAPEETVKKSKYVGKAERAKQLMESVKTGIKNEDALELPEMKALLSTASTRRPAVPKLNLLKDLKKHGANYENSAKIDKEAYANAGVKDSKEGIDDKPDLWLQKMGYMDFEESTEETVNQAWQMIEDALSGKEVYRLEDQDRVAQIEAYDANLKLLQEIFPDFMGVADTRRMISELERKGYRVVEKKDIKALEKALDRLTDTEKKKDEKQFLTMARRVREGVIAELEKRQIAGKDQMVELLKNAKTVEEITSAVEGVLGQVTSAWEQTEEGKQEQRKAELPKTDWGKKRAKLLAEINGIVKKAGESVAEAQKTLSSFVGRILTEEEAKEKERAERIIKNSNLEGQIIKALMESVRGEAHINPADINKIVARLAHSLQRNRLMTEYSVDDFIESAKKIQEKNYKKYIFKKLGDIFSRKVFEKVGTTKRLKYSPQAARFLTDAHKVWNDNLEKIQKEYYDIVKNLNKERQVGVDKDGNVVDKNLPPEPFEVLRRMAIALRADPEAQSMEVFKDFYENVLSAVRGDALEKRMEVLKRMVDEQTLRLAMGMALDKRKIGKAELNFLLYGGTDFQTMLSILFGKVKVMMPESDSGLVEIDFREELSPETEQIKAAIFVHEARQKLLKAVMDAYGLKSADQAVGKVAELQNDKMEILNYGEIKDESKGQIVARLFDENGKEYTNSKVEKETITKEEILTFWLWDQDHVFIETENGVEDFGLSGRLTRAYGREQLNAMFDKLTEEDKRFARSLQKMLSDVHQLESDVHFRTFGFALPKKENYFPSVTERTDDSIDYQQQMIDNSKSPSFVKERTISRNVRQKKVSPTKLVMSHLMRASEFIYESEKFNKLRRLINNPDTVRSFENKFGREDGKKIYKKLQDLVVLQGPAQRKTQGELLALAEKAFNGWVKASLGMKVVTGVKQFASSVSFAENMPAEKWAMWFAEGLANPRKTAEFMHKMSPYIQTRYESGGVNETVARAMTQDSIQPFATRWNNLTNMLLINTRLGDKASLIYGGYPYLRYLIEEKGMNPEAAARAFEKQAVRSMQSSLKANTSMSQANADSLPVRLVLAFKNQQMQYLRKVADSYVQWKNKEISTKQFGKVLFLYIVLNPTVYVLLSLGWFSDDEEERKNDLFRLLTAPLTQTLDAYPVAGAAMEFALESLYRVLQEEDLARPQSIGLPMVNDFYRDIGDVVSKINEGDAETMDFMMAFLDFAKYFGVPVGTLANTVGGVKDIATGKPVRGLMRTVGYTKNRSSKVTGDEE